MRRVGWAERIETGWPEDEPFVADLKLADIPQTMARAVSALPDNCVAVSCRFVGMAALRRVEQAARRKGVRILWLRLVPGRVEKDLE